MPHLPDSLFLIVEQLIRKRWATTTIKQQQQFNSMYESRQMKYNNMTVGTMTFGIVEVGERT
jgi:hypothetical protein